LPTFHTFPAAEGGRGALSSIHPTELYLFPGEGHDVVQVQHRQRRLIEEEKWFDKYFFK
jgi:dipeptidyl aminopeptidase/acylaminoacyl peptidase